MQQNQKNLVPTMATIASGYRVAKMFQHYAGVFILVGHNREAQYPWACWKWNTKDGHFAARYFRHETEANTLMLNRIRAIMIEE